MAQQEAEADHWKKHSVPSYDHGSHAQNKPKNQMSFGFPKKSDKHWKKHSVPSYDHGSHAKSRKDQLKEGLKDIVRNYPKPYYKPSSTDISDPNYEPPKKIERLHPAQMGMKRYLKDRPGPGDYDIGQKYEKYDAENQPYLKNIDLENKEHNPFDHRTKHRVLSDRLQDHYDLEHDRESPVFRYTEGSQDLNQSLIDNHKNGVSLPEHHEDHAKALDEELGRHRLPHDLVTYSGIKVEKFDPRKIMDKDGFMHSPAYMSSSILPNVAAGFAQTKDRDSIAGTEGSDQYEKHIIRFRHKKGDPGAFIEGNTNYSDEHEFLIPRGVKFKFKKTPETHETRDGTIVHFWDAEVHHPQNEQGAQRDFGFPRQTAPQSSQIDKYNQAMKSKVQNKIAAAKKRFSAEGPPRPTT